MTVASTCRRVLAVSVLASSLGAVAAPLSAQTASPAAPAIAPLADLVLPRGFTISVFASDQVGARMMTVSPEGVLLVARRRTHDVVALPDADKNGVAEPAVILTGLTNAHSLAFHDGYLYIATTPAVMRVRWASGAPAGTPEKFADLPASTPALHTSRTLGFGRDGRLYVAIGSSCDVCVESDPRRTTIQVFNADGSSAGAFATGLRNANGFDFDPRTGRLWAGDNGQDSNGPDFPPDELNAVDAGKHYGFPFFIAGNQPNQSEALKGASPTVAASAAVPPALLLPPHVAVAGLHFYTGTAFPPEFRNALFVAYHGSTATPPKVGYKVVRILMKGGRAVGVEDFVAGWLKGDAVSGRPAGFATGADGALYVSDDNKGFIYRITYRAP